MPYIGQVKEYDRINFLASQNFQAFTVLVDAASVPAGADGKKTLKAGTIYPANDATAQGVIFSDVDLDKGDQPASLIVAGFILEDRLPEAPASAAKTALTHIQFR